MNVGSEELKGDERVRQAADLLRLSHIASQFYGFVEGHDMAAGTTDVIVTDGFTGNVALKTAEGALKLVGDLLRQIFGGSIGGKLAYLLVRPGLDRMREWLDPRRYNGAVMLGLNGVVVKSHGGTDAEGFAHAVDVAMDMVVHGFNAKIRDGLAQDRRAAACPRPRRPRPEMARAIVAGIGGYLPAQVVTNDELSRTVDTTDAWIRERTGIRERRLAAPHETCSYMGAKAAQAALDDAGAGPGDVDAVILATATPDQAFPATAVRVQARSRHHAGLRLRHVGRLQRLRLCPVARGCDDPRRPGRAACW